MGSSIEGVTKPTSRRGGKSWRRPMLFWIVFLVGGGWLSFLAVTDAAPRVQLPRSPSAEQVVAARDALFQLAASQKAEEVGKIELNAEHLDGITALANQGFAPDRFDIYMADGKLNIAVSHLLQFGRWVNIDVSLAESQHGFPAARLRIGSLSFPQLLSRVFLKVMTQVVRKSWAADVPGLDTVVQSLSVKGQVLYATVQTGDLLDKLASNNGGFDSVLTLKKYCLLAKQQLSHPQSSLAIQVHRAFPADEVSSATVKSNRASIISLAMLVVDKRLGRLANLSDSDVARCRAPAIPITIHNREDLPKHMALSAAIAAGMGVQLAEAMGEWKELADSLSKQSRFQTGDPTGFSFVDLAADRSGFRIARAATSEVEAREMARRLSVATESTLLPEALLTFADGIKGEDFESAYGGISDPRFSGAVSSIDTVLNDHSVLNR